MRLLLAAGLVLLLPSLPYGFRSTLLPNASPRMLAWFGSATLVGIAAGFTGLLGTLVAPGPLPLPDLPRAVEVCFDAAGQLLSHPLKHWPSILAASILLLTAGRLVLSFLLVCRDARRARPPAVELPGERAGLIRFFGSPPPRVRLLPVEEPLAYTTGFVRPVTVLSRGLLRSLDGSQRAAVLAHERAHARHGHLLAFYVVRVIARAFGFLPGVGLSARYLVTALETRADDAAARQVEDRLVVAETLTAIAALGARTSQAASAMGGGEVTYRVRRLTAQRPAGPSRLAVAVAVLVTLASLLAQGFAWTAGRAALDRERLAIEMHDTCHLPHRAAPIA